MSLADQITEAAIAQSERPQLTRLARAVVVLMDKGQEFIAADIWDALDVEYGDYVPSAMGGSIKSMAKEGLIEKVNVLPRKATGEQAERNHNREQKVWRKR